MAVKIGFVDISKPLETLYLDSRYNFLYLVVNWGYRPITLVKLPNNPPYSFTCKYLKSHIRKAAGYLLWESNVIGRLDDLLDPLTAAPPISVVVCTRDRAISLDRCLYALSRVDYPNFEVIVVDNASSRDDVGQVVSKYNFRYVREERPGLDWARNRGILTAANDLIAYIDDDAFASPGWLRGIAHAFSNKKVMAVTGMVLPAELETPAQIEFEHYGGMNKGFEPFFVNWNDMKGPNRFFSSNWGVGTNMAFRRLVFEQIGMFDPALDVGTMTRGGGDLEFFFRVVSSGYLLRYEPAAMIQHTHRRSKNALLRQIRDNGQAFPAYLMTIARNHPELRKSIFWFGARTWVGGWLLRRIVSRDANERLWARTELRGSLSAVPAYRLAQKQARQLEYETDHG